jgi:DNA polymerase III delta subunit
MADFPKIHWLTGSYFARRIVFDKIIETIGKHEIYAYDESNEAAHIENQILNSDVFNDARVFVLTGLPMLGGTSKTSNTRYKKLFDSIPDNTYVIINGINKSDAPTIFEYVKIIGLIHNFPTHIDESDAEDWIRKRFEEEKISIEDQTTIKAIVNCLGEEYKKGVNFDKLFITVDMLVNYSDGKKLTIDDVKKSIYRKVEFVIWDLYDALDNKDFKKCQVLFSYMLQNSANLIEAVETFLAGLNWKYRLITLCKHLNPDKAADFFKDFYKLEKEEKENARFAKYKTVKDRAGIMAPRYSEAVVKAAIKGFFNKPPAIDKYTAEELESIISAISDTNLVVRSNIDEVVIQSMVDNVFMTICGIFNKERLSQQRRLDYV